MLVFIILMAVIAVTTLVLGHEISTLQNEVDDLKARTSRMQQVVPDIDDTIVERYISSQLENHAPPAPKLVLVPTELPCFDHTADPYDWSKDPVLSRAFDRGAE